MAIKEKDIREYLFFDEPVPYKNLKIRCATVKEYLALHTYSNALLAERDDPAMLAKPEDAEIVSKMDFLNFLFYLGTNHKLERVTGQPYLFLLDKLLKLVCDLPATKENQKTKKIEPYIDFSVDKKTGKAIFVIEDQVFTGEDIDNISDIICIQNGVEKTDYSKTKELRDILDGALEYKTKASGGKKTADFENQITALAVITGWTMDYIYKLSLRKFNQAISRADKIETWKIFTLASMTGLVKFPANTPGAEHWLCDLTEKDKYESVTNSLENLNKKISGEEAMEKAKEKIEKINHR